MYFLSSTKLQSNYIALQIMATNCTALNLFILHFTALLTRDSSPESGDQDQFKGQILARHKDLHGTSEEGGRVKSVRRQREERGDHDPWGDPWGRKRGLRTRCMYSLPTELDPSGNIVSGSNSGGFAQ